jgi:hypothetical protein
MPTATERPSASVRKRRRVGLVRKRRREETEVRREKIKII